MKGLELVGVSQAPTVDVSIHIKESAAGFDRQQQEALAQYRIPVGKLIDRCIWRWWILRAEYANFNE